MTKLNQTFIYKDCASMLTQVKGFPALPTEVKSGKLNRGCINMDLDVFDVS